LSTYLLAAVALAAVPTTAAVAETAELATLAVVDIRVPVTAAVVLIVLQPAVAAANTAHITGTIRNGSSLDCADCPRKHGAAQEAEGTM